MEQKRIDHVVRSMIPKRIIYVEGNLIHGFIFFGFVYKSAPLHSLIHTARVVTYWTWMVWYGGGPFSSQTRVHFTCSPSVSVPIHCKYFSHSRQATSVSGLDYFMHEDGRPIKTE